MNCVRWTPSGRVPIRCWEWIRALSAVAVLAGCVGCDTEDGAPHINTARGALQAVSDESGPAAGPVIAVEVEKDTGDIVCTKSDGGIWSSEKGGVVEFYLRENGGEWKLAGPAQPYDAPTPETATKRVVLPGAAFQLGVGTGYSAQCKAIPFIDIPPSAEWTYCSDPNGGEDKVCTLSGVYDFSIVPSSAPPPLGQTSCGNGKGKSNGVDLCVPRQTVPKGTYDYPFPCSRFHSYDVRLFTSGASSDTTLTVYDAASEELGISSSDGNVDQITFVAVSSGECLARVEAHVESTFMLHVKDEEGLHPQKSSLLAGDKRITLMQAQPGDIILTHYKGCEWEQYLPFAPPHYCHSGMIVTPYPDLKIIQALPDPGVFESRDSGWTDSKREILVVRPNVSEEMRKEAVKAAQSYIGKPYKIKTTLDDPSGLYCSKLVWKAYKDLGVDIVDDKPSFFEYGYAVLPDNLASSSKVTIVGGGWDCAPFVDEMVMSVSPKLDQSMTFTFNGACLDNPLAGWIADCAGASTTLLSKTSAQLSCTPKYSTGLKQGVLKQDGVPAYNFAILVQ